jgi:hypothetical protein
VLPPVLEVYVVRHPGDAGSGIAHAFIDHFHGTAYTGLIGGAVEVYVRSAGWTEPGGVPRPIPFPGESAPGGVPTAEFVVVVPVAGYKLAKSVEGPGPWQDYVRRLVQAQREDPDGVGIFPVVVDQGALSGTELGRLIGSRQAIGSSGSDDAGSTQARCRDLAQGIAQLADPTGGRVTIFLSHTKWAGTEERGVPELIDQVRRALPETRLDAFFDAHDLQPGEDWSVALRKKAGQGAMLALRTDLYASREWCQREMLIAKKFGVPVVILDALGEGEERGSFLMDHVPRVPVRRDGAGWRGTDVRRGLDLLVDEHLKRVLWRRQQALAVLRPDLDVDWWAPHAPEPVTLTEWLASGGGAGASGRARVLHPDPPLGVEELRVLDELARLVGLAQGLDVMTPRQLAARGA